MLNHVDGSKYLTVNEAARELDVEPVAIRNYLHAGKIKTYKFKTLTLLSADDVKAWKERQRK